ncbi:MAG TPA: glycosyltransferase family 39 protein [Candidatus Aquicultor sp.]|jgi:hypothetical protein
MDWIRNRLKELDAAAIIVIVALIFGALLRIGAWHQGEGRNVLGTSTDSLMYENLAKDLLAGKGYIGTDHMIARTGQQTAFYGPTYPFYLVAVHYVFGSAVEVAQASNMILGILTAIAVFMLGSRMYGRLRGAGAAFIVAVSPQLIYYGFRLMSETLYIFLQALLLIAIVVILKKDKPSLWALAGTGVLFGITYLCRQVVFVLPVILLPIWWLRYKENGYSWMAKTVGMFLVGTMLILGPWVVRNYVTFHEVMFGTTTGPATLWWGSLEDKGYSLSLLQIKFRNEHPNMNEVQLSHLCSQEAKYNLLHLTRAEILYKIGNRPRKLLGFPRNFDDISDPQVFIGISYLTLTVLGIAGLFMGSRRRYDRILVAWFAVALLAVPLLTHVVFRYIMPVVPLLALGAANFVFIVVQKARVSAGA